MSIIFDISGCIQGSCSSLTEETASEPITCQDSEEKDQHHVSLTPPQCRGSHSNLNSCEAVLTQKLKCLELQNSLSGNTDLGYHKSLALDPSCLLTPPNTPQSLEQAELEASLLEGAAQQMARQHRKGNITSAHAELPLSTKNLSSYKDYEQKKRENTRFLSFASSFTKI